MVKGAKSGYWGRALDLLEPRADVVALGTALSACERVGEWRQAIGGPANRWFT